MFLCKMRCSKNIKTRLLCIYTLLCVYGKKTRAIPYQPITPQSTGIKIIHKPTFSLFSAKIDVGTWTHYAQDHQRFPSSFFFLSSHYFVLSVVTELFNKNNNNKSIFTPVLHHPCILIKKTYTQRRRIDSRKKLYRAKHRQNWRAQ